MQVVVLSDDDEEDDYKEIKNANSDDSDDFNWKINEQQ